MKFLFVKQRLLVWYVLSFAAIPVSCIHDIKECKNESIIINFSYTLPDDETNIFNERARNVDIFLFDNLYNLVKTSNYDTDHTQNISTVDLGEIEPGEYRIVAWINATPPDYNFENTRIVTSDTFGNLYLKVNTANDTVKNQFNDLYYGCTQFVFSHSSSQTVTIPVMKNTKEVTVNIEGIEASDENRITVEITGGKDIYYFDNTMGGDNNIIYLPHSSLITETSLEKVFTLQRIYIGDSYRLICRQKAVNSPIFDQSLSDLIEESYNGFGNLQEFIDKQEELQIKINVEIGPDGVYIITSIQINNWESITYPNAGI